MHSNNSLKKIIISYLIALIPLIIYGFYKNGYLPYKYYNHSLSILLKPLILPCFSLLIAMLIDKIFKRETFSPLIAVISSMIIPTNTPYLVFFIPIIFILLLVPKFKNFNTITLFKLLIIVYLLLNNSYTYLNIYEQNKSIYYSTFDLFLGRSRGGICSSNIFLCLISYIFLALNPNYKKEIPFMIIISSLITSLIFIPFQTFNNILINYLNSTIVFSSIFIAPIPIYSPTSKKNIIIYSLTIGIISSILINNHLPYEGTYISLLIVSICGLILKAFNERKKKNEYRRI